MKKFDGNSRLLPWLMAPALSVFLVACGGGGQDPILGAGGIAPVFGLPPTVTVATPSVGALNVATNTKTITAAFSKAMDPATLTASSFTLACPAAASITGG
ncbi:MAG TPA: Ig-like domain-containing protein, partial [Rhodoferax sp.]|nr:Ig-like domain-containing protein [Rhodoferax sp.]